ncbi:3-deoxy-D-manno-octulosonic acid transferase [Saccharibacter sp. 17.LH.SD]|uniref:3-deoxy-D-manno-octulosonic acid transferase n=1 Tax=Saccharibacter sp. 17.LH.SD TaxID=2689393 RepID=UPI00136A2B5F|nr:glycosyltransferase N-terminal domain-containing protein [Saccharibacter sp. 17.LH.SD]MXV44526.1 3-deoxy-D-manno-octulosonic acid transferase [Saccharibacter sp. 17.LH.SD]
MPLPIFDDPILALWSLFGRAASPLIRLMMHHRLKIGKEEETRIQERRGLLSAASPSLRADIPLLWIHTASVGETLSIFPLVTALLNASPQLHILVTTTTVTGARTIERHPHFGKRLYHQFIPYDLPYWTRNFLSHWQPIGALFVESELWPGTIRLCHRLHIPLMLINARLSDQSFRRWQKGAFFLRYMLDTFRWISARSQEDTLRFQQLGLHPIALMGDIKEDADPLPSFPQEEERLRRLIGKRPVFVAASTHPGEEEIVVEAMQYALQKSPDLLTIIIPRHPERGVQLARQYHAPCRSAGQDPLPHHTLWIADTLGEMGLFYRLGDRIFLGNSLIPSGKGHNPFEPLRLQRPTATGPWRGNWRFINPTYDKHLHRVSDAQDLSVWILSPAAPVPSPQKGKEILTKQLTIRILDTIFSHITVL